MDQCRNFTVFLLSYTHHVKTACTHFLGFTRAVMWRLGAAARKDAVFVLCSSLLVLWGTSSDHWLWFYFDVSQHGSSGGWFILTFTVQTVASCHFHDISTLYDVVVKPNHWPLVWKCLSRPQTGEAVKLCLLFPKEIQRAKLVAEGTVPLSYYLIRIFRFYTRNTYIFKDLEKSLSIFIMKKTVLGIMRMDVWGKNVVDACFSSILLVMIFFIHLTSSLIQQQSRGRFFTS